MKCVKKTVKYVWIKVIVKFVIRVTQKMKMVLVNNVNL